MELSVQLAARRLGVSPHTIRRWTASGFLPCTRSAGGHRRIKEKDIAELEHLIGGRNHLAARLARERELEALTRTAVAVAGRLDLSELLHDLARQMTMLLDCHFCAIAGYDEDTRRITALANYDRLGERVDDPQAHPVHESPSIARALEEHEPLTVNVSDPQADPAEAAILRRDGDRCLLVLPMVHQGRVVGLLELLDHRRERHFSRQEMRLATAIVAQAAVALHHAKVCARLKRSDDDTLTLRRAIDRVAASHTHIIAQEGVPGLLEAAAMVAVSALDGVSCVASHRDTSAGASALSHEDLEAADPAPQIEPARVLVAAAPCAGDRLVLTLTLPHDAGQVQGELLGLLAAVAGGRLADLLPGA
jgi:excisionase family DNA binding protein